VAELKQADPPLEAEGPDLTAPEPRRRRSVAAWLGLLVVVVGAVLASNMFSIRDDLFGSAVPEPAPVVGSRDAFSAIGNKPATHTKLRSQAWWQDVTTLKGTGAGTSAPFTIVSGAIQWRVKTTCGSGRIVVRVPGKAEPLVDASCAKPTVIETTGSGPMRVQVQSAGPWRIDVGQQIDAPLVEPPRPAMTAPGASRAAAGSFYDVEKKAKGTITLYRQAGGRYSLRLEHFFVTPTIDLQLRLSTRGKPRTTRDYTSGGSKLVSVMDVTAGSLNFTVPAGVDPTKFGSVVIWCAATAQVYAAADLKRVA
jgi:hypothetical protein